MKEAQRTTVRNEKREAYVVDAIFDSKYYKECYEHEPLSDIKEKMPWPKSERVVVQQNDANPRTSRGTGQNLKRVGKERS